MPEYDHQGRAALHEIHHPFSSPDAFEAWGRALARHGAKEALADLGLNDDSAREDLAELRAMLRGLRVARSEFFRAVVKAFGVSIGISFLAFIFWMVSLGGHK